MRHGSFRWLTGIAGALFLTGLLPVVLSTGVVPAAAATGADVLWPRDGLATEQSELWLQIELPQTAEPLRTEFFMRRSGGEAFTLAVMPDTQHYTDDPANWPLFGAQTDWIVENRDAKNIVFTVHVGDLVQNRSKVEQEWIVADEAFDTLDAAGMPVAVVPGNHDSSLNGSSYLFDQYFPPERWSDQSWYGGYLGSDPRDPADTGSRNSYQYFSAGADDFLILNLDWTVPGPALAWGQRIIDEHPNRKVIINTHVFLDADGVLRTSVFAGRPNGRSAQEIFDQLVASNCSVMLVLAGHYSGEAHRRAINECGDPVHLVTADYQNRANGGDGWMRYMEFDPATDSVDVVTYSPVLDRYERDADSAFTLDVDLAGASSGTFSSIGSRTTTGRTRVGTRAADLQPGGYEWYAVVTDTSGVEVARSPVSSFVVEGVTEVDTPPTISGLRFVPPTSTTPGRIVADLADDNRVAQVLAVVADNQTGLFWRGGDEWGARKKIDVTPSEAGTSARLDVELPGLVQSGYRVKLWIYDDASQEKIARLQFQNEGTFEIGPDVTAPASIIASPAKGSTGAAPLVISGRATDDRGVSEVLVVIKDEHRNLFWNGSGFQSRWVQVAAEVESPGSTATSWTYEFTGPVPTTKLYLSSRAVDGAGNEQDAPFWITVRTP